VADTPFEFGTTVDGHKVRIAGKYGDNYAVVEDAIVDDEKYVFWFYGPYFQNGCPPEWVEDFETKLIVAALKHMGRWCVE
jgi:hypothetical protein